MAGVLVKPYQIFIVPSSGVEDFFPIVPLLTLQGDTHFLSTVWRKVALSPQKQMAGGKDNPQ